MKSNSPRRSLRLVYKTHAIVLAFLLLWQPGTILAQDSAATLNETGLFRPAITLEESLEEPGKLSNGMNEIPRDFLDNSPLSPVSAGNTEGTLNESSNDPFSDTQGTWGNSYADLYWLNRVRAEEAWAFTRGSGATIAVVDSGLDIDHPDIAANVFKNEAELNGLPGVDDDGNGFIDDISGWDFVGGTNAPDDLNGHGTHVAGILGAVADNLIGIAGIAPEVSILPVRVLNSSGNGFLDNVIAGIRYAADMGADVINMSLGGAKSAMTTAELQSFQSAIDYALGLGTIIVTSAGNESSYASLYAPAGLNNVIAVGATNPGTDSRASFSNYGSALDLVAPGVDVLSLKSGESFCYLCSVYPELIVQNDYLRLSGTSMSSPIVAGAVALMRAFDPLLTYEDILRRLSFSSEDLGASGKDSFYGWGMLDVFEAISTDYYTTGEIKDRWLAEADAEGVTRLSYDLMGRVTRKTLADGGAIDLTYWSGTTNVFEEIFYDDQGDWVKTFEYYEDGVTLHYERYPDGTVIDHGQPAVEYLNFNDYTVQRVNGQGVDGNYFEIKDGGATLRLFGNTWNAIRINQTLKADTVIEFDFRNTGEEGEISGFSFASSLDFAQGQSRSVQLQGTQTGWAKYQQYTYTAPSGQWQHFEIPIGELYTGSFPYMYFINDADAGQATNIEFRNIAIAEKAIVAPPGVNALSEATNQTLLTLGGSKAPGTSIWINGAEAVAANGLNTWSYDVTLVGETEHIFDITARDAVGQESVSVQVKTVLDQTEPTGSVLIDGGAAETADLQVDLTLTQTDATPDQMRIFVEGSDVTGWVDYQTSYSVTLPEGDGEKTVRVEYRDKAGNVSTDIIEDTITLALAPLTYLNFNDFTVKKMTGQDIQGGYEVQDGGATLRVYGNTWHAIALNQQITADTVLEFDFKNTGEEGEIAGLSFSSGLNFESAQARSIQVQGTQRNWATYETYSYTDGTGGWQHFTIPVGELFTGTFPYLGFLNDADAGQATNVYFRNIVIHETTGPVTPPGVNALSEATNQTLLTLGGSKTPGTSIWINGAEAVAANGLDTWAYDVTLAGETEHIFDITARDAEGQESTPVQVKTVLDQTEPSGSVLIDGGAGTTTDLQVDLTLTQIDATPDQMRIFVEGADVTGWVNYQTSYSVTLPGGDGEKTVRVEYRDKAGNVSTDIIEDTIMLEAATFPNLNFNNYVVHGVSDQAGVGGYEVKDSGATFRLYGNAWKGIWVNKPITAGTVIEFDFRSTGEMGEIAGFAFTSSLTTSQMRSRAVHLSGTQDEWAPYKYDYTQVGDWQHFSIPVGSLYTGILPYLVFINDADAGQATNIEFRNVSVHD